MTVIKGEVIVPERKTEKIVAIVCDCCKREFKGDGASEYEGEVEWPHERNSFHHTDTAVVLQETAAYPGDVTWEASSYHICPDCMKTVVFPFLQEKCGMPPHETID